jgi:hypothetical protein
MPRVDYGLEAARGQELARILEAARGPELARILCVA